MDSAQAIHAQQTFLRLGDEFLLQYFLTARRDFKQSQILSRLFAMGHSLELYLKAALISPEGLPPHGHDIPELLTRFDATLLLTAEEMAAGETLLSSQTRNVDLGLWNQHEEALELYQAEYFVTDLKYYLTKNNEIIYPVIRSLKPVNTRFLGIVHKLRTSLAHRLPVHDSDLLTFTGLLGFEENPALQVINGQ